MAGKSSIEQLPEPIRNEVDAAIKRGATIDGIVWMLSRGIRQLIVEPVREHSRKPDRVRADIEALFDGPYCELFARSTRPGWTSWGNETGKFAEVRP